MPNNTNFERFENNKEKTTITPTKLKQLRQSFDFTQKQMADILGIHPNALQNMEYGKNPIPKYIKNYANSLTILNVHRLLKWHIKNIGVDLAQ